MFKDSHHLITNSDRVTRFLPGLIGASTLGALYPLKLISALGNLPWYMGPFWKPGSIPGDVAIACVNESGVSGYGDFLSIACQARLRRPYSAEPPSTQTPALLTVHELLPIYHPHLVASITILISALVIIHAKPSRTELFNFAPWLCLSSIFAIDRGNFAWIMIAALAFLTSRRVTQRNYRLTLPTKTARNLGLVFMAILGLKVSSWPILLLAFKFSSRTAVRILSFTSSGLIAYSAIGLLAGYDVWNFPTVLLMWSSIEPAIEPLHLYSMDPSAWMLSGGTRVRPFAAGIRVALYLPCLTIALISVLREVKRSPQDRYGTRRHFERGHQSLALNHILITTTATSYLVMAGTGANYQIAVGAALLCAVWPHATSYRRKIVIVTQLVSLALVAIGLPQTVSIGSEPLAYQVHFCLGLSLTFVPIICAIRCLAMLLSKERSEINEYSI